MLIVALVMAVIGLAALVTAVVTSNELVAWVCIGASALGVALLVVDAVRERQDRRLDGLAAQADDTEESDPPFIADAENTQIIENTEIIENTGIIENTETSDSTQVLTDDDNPFVTAEDHPEELVHDEPEYDMPSDDEPEYSESAEDAAIHIVDEQTTAEESGDIVGKRDDQ